MRPSHCRRVPRTCLGSLSSSDPGRWELEGGPFGVKDFWVFSRSLDFFPTCLASLSSSGPRQEGPDVDPAVVAAADQEGAVRREGAPDLGVAVVVPLVLRAQREPCRKPYRVSDEPCARGPLQVFRRPGRRRPPRRCLGSGCCGCGAPMYFVRSVNPAGLRMPQHCLGPCRRLSNLSAAVTAPSVMYWPHEFRTGWQPESRHAAHSRSKPHTGCAAWDEMRNVAAALDLHRATSIAVHRA